MRACLWSRVNSKKVDDKPIFFSDLLMINLLAVDDNPTCRGEINNQMKHRLRWECMGNYALDRYLNSHQMQDDLWSRTWDAQCMCTICVQFYGQVTDFFSQWSWWKSSKKELTVNPIWQYIALLLIFKTLIVFLIENDI